MVKEKVNEKEKENEKGSCLCNDFTPMGRSPLINRRFLLTFACPDSAFLLSRFFLFPISCVLFFGVFFAFQFPPFVKFCVVFLGVSAFQSPRSLKIYNCKTIC